MIVDKKHTIRFYSKIKKVVSCSEWRGGFFSTGYGRFSLKRKSVLAHRVAYFLENGEIPTGKCVLHKCDNKKCVAPQHLFLGTHQENSTDMINKKRSAAGLKNPMMRNLRTPDKREWWEPKLEEKDIPVIRELRKNGYTYMNIANKFGVTRKCISKIIDKKTWKHV